jgi:hypothetical protein
MATENLTLAQFFGSNRNPYNYVNIEQVSRDLTTGWLTLEEITQQLNLFEDESQDGYLRSLEVAVRMAIEDYLGLSIFPTQYRVYYGTSGIYDPSLYLDLPETTGGVTIDQIVYYADASATTPVVLPRTSYFLDPTGKRVVITQIPTTLNQYVENPIVLTYTQNANFLSQYPVIKQAGLLLFTHLYNNRSDTDERIMRQIPFGVQTLLRPYKPLVM